MKQHLVLGAVGALALVPITATAQAAAPAPKKTFAMRTTVGKTVSSKGGKLRVAARGKNVDFVVDEATECGVSRGKHPTIIRCADLGQKRYLSKRVRVAWYFDAKRRRVAAVVAVMLAA